MVDFARTEPSSVVLLVDGVGHTDTCDIGPRVVLPSVLDYEIPEADQRVEMQGDGCRLIVKSRRFARTDERYTDSREGWINMPVYRLVDVTGRPPIRERYR